MGELSDRVAQAIWGCGMDATYREQGVAALAVMTDALAASAARIEAKDAALKEARDLITWHDNRVLLEGSRRVVGIIDAALDAAPRSDVSALVTALEDWKAASDESPPLARTIDDGGKP